MKGTIAGKNEEKFFGFITPEGMADSKENNVFFHTSACVEVPFADLKQGDMVEFDTEPAERGPRAINIKRAS